MINSASKLLFIIFLFQFQSCENDFEKRVFCGTDFNGFPDIPGWQFTVWNTPPTDESLYFTHFTNENTGFVFRRDGIWRTLNQGQSWDRVFEGTELWFRDVSFADSLSWFASVSNSNKALILKTINGGDTWTTYDASTIFLKNLTFIDSLNGFGVNTYNFYKSTDGGITWKANNDLTITSSTTIEIDENRIGYLNGLYKCSILI